MQTIKAGPPCFYYIKKPGHDFWAVLAKVKAQWSAGYSGLAMMVATKLPIDLERDGRHFCNRMVAFLTEHLERAKQEAAKAEAARRRLILPSQNDNQRPKLKLILPGEA